MRRPLMAESSHSDRV